MKKLVVLKSPSFSNTIALSFNLTSHFLVSTVFIYSDVMIRLKVKTNKVNLSNRCFLL